MGKPSVILTSQFTTPDAKSFSSYLKYMTRKEALKEHEKSLSSLEMKELSKLESVIESYDMKIGNSETALVTGKLTEKEEEALNILQSPDYFDDEQFDYAKYIDYMGRQYALNNKKRVSIDEKKELSVVRKKIFNMVGIKENEDRRHPEIKQGVFSMDKKSMTKDDVKEVSRIVKNAQKNGSIFYQDVISFDTDFLIKEGIYNPERDYLDEHRIQNASRKMMDQMFEDEKIESGYWFATIHRNTDHIHIHYGTVEMKNTRQIVTVKENGVEYLAPKGKRKQQTIDNMKSTFANSLIDRTAELTRISELRNTLVDDIKESYIDKKNSKELNLLKDIYEELPSNKKHWQYGSKYMSESAREKIDILTNALMKDNESFKEYVEKIEDESFYRKELFGESSRTDKDYASNKMKDINKRMGNALLREMKKGSLQAENNRTIFLKDKQIHRSTWQKNNNRFNGKLAATNTNLKKIKRVLNDDYDKYRAEKEYEMLEERIQREQEKNRL